MIFQVLHDTICFQVLGNLQLDSPKTAHHVTQGKTIILNKEVIISLNVNALVRKEWEEFLSSKSKDKNYKTDKSLIQDLVSCPVNRVVVDQIGRQPEAPKTWSKSVGIDKVGGGGIMWAGNRGVGDMGWVGVRDTYMALGPLAQISDTSWLCWQCKTNVFECGRYRC